MATEVSTGPARLSSGHHRLDAVLGGGVSSDALTLITGAPGTGKTLLAQQFVFSNATADRPALYVSTVSEPLGKILRYGRSLSFFDEDRVGKEVFYEDLGGLLDERGLPAFVERLEQLVAELRPAIIVVDSFKALHAFAREPSDFRWFLHDFAARLSASGASSFWVGEYGPDDIVREPEFAVADCHHPAVVGPRARAGDARAAGAQAPWQRVPVGPAHLPPVRRRRRRVPEAGRHVRPDQLPLLERRISSGIPALDTILGDGYWRGACTLVAGPSGSAKTVMGLSFIFGGGSRRAGPDRQPAGEPDPAGAHRTRVRLVAPRPRRLAALPLVGRPLHRRMGARGAGGGRDRRRSRLLIDSVGDLAFSSPDPVRFPRVHLLARAALLPPGASACS